MTELAVVIPSPSRASDLEILLPKLQAVIAQFAIPARVVVMDDGSWTGAVAVAAGQGATVLRQRGAGYGGAIRTAIEDLDATYIVTLDADGAHQPGLLYYLYAARTEADIVIASRYVRQGYARMPFMRSALSRALNATFSRFLDLPVRDLSSGYRLYRREAVMKLAPTMETYAVLQEILIKAYCEGYAIKEIPMHYTAARPKDRARLAALGMDYVRTLGAMWRLRNSVESCDYDTRAFNSVIPLQRYWQRRRYRIITEYIGDAPRVLDAGCGSTQMLNGAPQVVGLDPQLRKLRFMQMAGRRLVNGSTLALPFRSEAFDVVVSSQVIEHLPPEQVIFDELVRCIRPGGALILGTVDYGGWQWPLIERAYGFVKPSGYVGEHITHYTRDSLFDRLRRMGLDVLDHQYILGGEIIIKARKP